MADIFFELAAAVLARTQRHEDRDPELYFDEKRCLYCGGLITDRRHYPYDSIECSLRAELEPSVRS